MANISQIYDIDLKLLRCFCTIVEEQSFTAAQAALNLSQSTLSENLKSLEIRLGTRLCRRGPKGFKLFREGEAVYKAAKELFASVEAFRQKASNINQSAGYELCVGIQDGIVENPSARIHEAIHRFSEYYPNVRFRMEVMQGFQLTGRVAEGMIHVGIGLVNDQFPQLSYEHLFDEQGFMCCSDKHPFFAIPDEELTLQDIETAAYCNRGHLEYYHPERSRHGVTCGDIGLGIQAQLALILSGRNIGYVLDQTAQPLIAGGMLRPLKPDEVRIVNPVTAMMGPGAADFKLARRFVDCLVDVHMELGAERLLPRPAFATSCGTVVEHEGTYQVLSAARSPVPGAARREPEPDGDGESEAPPRETAAREAPARDSSGRRETAPRHEHSAGVHMPAAAPEPRGRRRPRSVA
ncbi:LysR family transcriptional regulator [Ancylobacter sp. 6x-1]|uniref:LysR family transcriptional regulator n=1 Tax=Ancylobacter crimeensis TaxID=2579147 RepID=A0ABT0DFZ5_9HYPH|nr:LysR family transcriptional regulator [Ancylobacter crimeensis]MCK0198878.1 LysR family transcriptional regulator [Ancylobacter crimeensis]